MFMNISIYLVIAITPFIPLFMGFRERYLEFFEKYMEYHDGLLGDILLYLCLILISPFTISRPYLAWISSLVSKSRWIVDSYKRTHHNYLNFVKLALIIAIILIVSHYIDAFCHINTMIVVMSLVPVYFNIVFINIYKVFYQRKAKTKTASDKSLPQK